VGAVLTAQGKGTLKSRRSRRDGNQIEITVYGAGAAAVVSDIERLASRIGAAVEQVGRKVILTVSPEGMSHSKD